MYPPNLLADIAALRPDLFKNITGPSNMSVPGSIHGDMISPPEYLTNADSNVPNLNGAGNDMAFTPAPATSIGSSTAQSNYAYTNVPQSWPTLAQVLFDMNSLATQLVSDPHWTGVTPHPVNSAATTPNLVVSPSSSTTPPVSQEEWTWNSEAGQFTNHIPSSSSSYSREVGVGGPEYGANCSGSTRHPMEWTAPAWSIPGNVMEDNKTLTTMTTRASGKRRHDDGEVALVVTNGHEKPPQKRVRRGRENGIPKAARSTPRTRRKPVARIPKQGMNSKPKEAGRGAWRLATPDSQGIHHQSLLGPSLQQGWAEEAADGQLIWVEGSVEEVARRTDSAVQQQEEAQQEYFEIPRNFKPGFKALLATQTDSACETVREIKCRLCPDAKFKKWSDFMRHCKCSEIHPLTIYFCNYCGDHFGRSDACRRHCNHRPAECLQVAPEEADKKRRVIQQAHDEYIKRLSEGDTRSFSQIIKEMFPSSSKRP